MDYWKGILFLVRKKSVGPPVIALSIIVAGLVYFLLPTVYVSTASMVLTAPATGGTLPREPVETGGLTNPLLQFNDGLRTTAGILILAMNAPDVMAELGIEDGGPTRLIVNDGRTNPELLGISTNGPFIYAEAESTSAAAARDTVIRARKRIQTELIQRQQALRAPRSTFIWMTDVVPPSTPEPKFSAKFTASASALVVTLLAGFGLAYAVTQIRAGRAAAPAGHADSIRLDMDPAPAEAVSRADSSAASLPAAPTPDRPALAPAAADESDPADPPEHADAPDPAGPVATTVDRRSEWPEVPPEEPRPGKPETGEGVASTDGPKTADRDEPVAVNRPGDSDERSDRSVTPVSRP